MMMMITKQLRMTMKAALKGLDRPMTKEIHQQLAKNLKKKPPAAQRNRITSDLMIETPLLADILDIPPQSADSSWKIDVDMGLHAGEIILWNREDQISKATTRDKGTETNHLTPIITHLDKCIGIIHSI